MADEITQDTGLPSDPGVLQFLMQLLSPSSAEAAMGHAGMPGPTFEQRQQLEQQKAAQALQMLQEKARLQAAQQAQDPLRQAQVAKTQASIAPQTSIESILGGGQPTSPEGAGSSIFAYGGGGAGLPMEQSNERIRMILDALTHGEAPPGQDPLIGSQVQKDFTPVSLQPGQPFRFAGYEDMGFDPKTGAFTNIGLPQAPGIAPTAPAPTSTQASAIKRAEMAASIKSAYPHMPEKELENLLDAQFPTSVAPAGATGEAVLQGLEPGLAGLVKQVANYQVPIAGFGGMDAKTRAKVLPLVSQYDPTFDATQYAARVKLRQDFAAGTNAKNIVSLNTAIQHMASFKQAADQLNNAGPQLWNYIANKGLEATGDPRVQNLTMAADALAGELSKVFKGTSGTDQEIKAWRSELSSSLSPAQFQAALDKGVELLGGRFEAIRDLWTKTMGKPLEGSLLSPGASKIITRMGYNPAIIEKSAIGEPPPSEAPIAETKPRAKEAPTKTTTKTPPTGAVDIHRTYQGKPVYRFSDGTLHTLD